ncbi:MAG TPA: YifB family Mg chelatase-like AAA ATPase [Solirubrobacteraceae bacterium]|nr:YifB family Mg chelatase-like AAA ATPase [Solirubrobacteraceae bacterium]
MLARAHTFTIEGLQTRHVTVEVDVRPGLAAFTIVGLADAAVREALERVRAAILNSGFEFPGSRITANLAPGNVPKAGPGVDLALACAVLAASGQLPSERLATHALLGELALGGELRPCDGTLAVALAAHERGMRALIVAAARCQEAHLVSGLQVVPAERLSSAVRVLRGGPADRVRAGDQVRGPRRGSAAAQPDLSDLRGQHHAVRTLVIAAAGDHNCLLSGPPGTGKTMLAHRLPSILPPLSRSEALEVTRLRSVLGSAPSELAAVRPFRAPHHSTTAAGLIGGGNGVWAGEAVLAHNGVLFLDELCEFARATLDALRQPLEEGRIAIARARHTAVYPARFMLVAATNPCSCGYAGEAERCSCSEVELARHRRRLSGPLIDRIDLLAQLARPRSNAAGEASLTSSAVARERVIVARERQARRLAGEGILANSHMNGAMLERHVRLDARGEELLRRTRESGLLSTRGQHRALRVARTIADLRGGEQLLARDLGAALALRPEATLAANRAA